MFEIKQMKIVRNYFEIKAATNEVDMATKPSLGKSEGG